MFDLPRASLVNLRVYDALGRKIAILVNETRLAGRHTVTFASTDSRGKALPSGAYYARIQAAGVEGTVKMILAK
jgi:hypothetical protein